VPITIRPGTMDDLPFIDALQKKHTKQVGFMPTKQFEGKIKAGHVLVAEERHEGTEARRHEGVMEAEGNAVNSLDPSVSGPHSVPTCLRASVPVGYLIGNDQYFKRDDVGIIYQINIAEGKRRSLVGAMLLKAQFDRSAYGCRLYCCWCAQDIEANRFWESMGFVPLAFRAGSRGKDRVHIFWQRRIRAGDETTPYWFPSQTTSGAIREDRLVFPIPPGKHWSDEMPRILPKEHPRLAAPDPKPLLRTKSKIKIQVVPTRALGGWGFTPPEPPKPAGREQSRGAQGEKPKRACPEQSRRAPRAKVKNDPRLVAAARELRDRWLERVNTLGGASVLLANGKYDVSRSITSNVRQLALPLPDAA
jgi:hypothetical protein